MHQSWTDKLQPIRQLAKSAFDKVHADRTAGKVIYPPNGQIFNAFNMPFDAVKVVIIGQDPYHGAGQANGLAFSVNKDVWVPPSLINIYTEVHNDIGCDMAGHGDLSSWRDQGVLLLNTSLTVEDSKPGSHKDIGWYQFIYNVINLIQVHHSNLVFILWGKHAQGFKDCINKTNSIIESAHPSPYSAGSGFFGSRPFSRANSYLSSYEKQTIDWEIK